MPTDFFGSSFFSGSDTFSFTTGFFATGCFTVDGIILGTFFHVRNLLINRVLINLNLGVSFQNSGGDKIES